MFSRNWFVLILFFGQLLSSDNESESECKKRFTVNPLAKKVISFAVGLVVAGISQKGVFITNDEREGKRTLRLDGFLMDDIGSLFLSCCFANLKTMPHVLVDCDLISFENGEKLCGAISVLHGLCAGAICHYGLKKFFPD